MHCFLVLRPPQAEFYIIKSFLSEGRRLSGQYPLSLATRTKAIEMDKYDRKEEEFVFKILG